MKKLISIFIIIVFLFNSMGCGTILHPERKGQSSGQIDPSIAILNGLGLLLYLIPGVIAFAVDFNNGSIYLPGTQGSLNEDDGTRVVKFEGELDLERLEKILEDETGKELDLKKDLTLVTEPETIEEAKQRLVFINQTLLENIAKK